MLARKRNRRNEASLSREIRKARETLDRKGWSYRAAAPLLGVGYVHLARVLTGHRESRRLLLAIEGLPDRAETDRAA